MIGGKKARTAHQGEREGGAGSAGGRGAGCRPREKLVVANDKRARWTFQA